MSETFHFQVNLGGMLDILSNHLYKTTDVFLWELLQNGVDAITMRKKNEPRWTGGKITISLIPREQMIFHDNGAGRTEKEIHHFLSVIGQSSKQQLEDGNIPEDYIGRFGIGLLSCFMEALSSLLSGVQEKPLSTLYLNGNNPLIQRLVHMKNKKVLQSVGKVLYIHALVTVGHTLRHRELRILSQELLYLIDYNESIKNFKIIDNEKGDTNGEGI